MNLIKDIDEAINNGIDILKNDVELLFREFAADAKSVVTAEELQTMLELENNSSYSARVQTQNRGPM